jgi:hypothetical protein
MPVKRTSSKPTQAAESPQHKERSGLRVFYNVWAYPIGPEQHRSVSATGMQFQATDEPALMIVCPSVEDRDKLRNALKEKYGG